MANITAENLFNVKGMSFVISGGGTGIGAMMAKALDANGAKKVFILGRRMDKLEESASKATNKSVVPIQCDFTSQGDLLKAVETVKSHIPYVNAVLANHGAMGPTLDDMPENPSLEEMQAFLWKTPIVDFNETFLANISAVFYAFVAFLALLKAGNEHPESPGKQLNIKSQMLITSSQAAYSRIPKMGYAYSASKYGVIQMMKQLATTFVPYGMRVNVFAPGIYPSDMSAAFMKTVGAEEIPRTIVPIQRIGTEEDVAGMILFICSRAGAYINGNVLLSDGGRLCGLPATY